MKVRTRKLVEWSIFLLLVFGAWLLAGPSSMGGPASYILVDGRSMEPTYEDGDLVVAYQRNEYDVGDVIVYDASIDAQFNVIHRIVDTADGGFVTQGDNRDEVDGWIAPHDEIHGAALFHIPRGGDAVLFLRQPATILAMLAAWGTFAYLRRREDQGTAAGDEGSPASDPDEIAGKARATRTATRAEARRQRAESRSQTLLLLGVAAAIGGAGGLMVANAASLKVDAGVLQVFSSPVPHEESSTAGVASIDESQQAQEICDGYEGSSFCGGPSDQGEQR